MTDPFLEPQGILPSTLSWLDRSGQVTRNVLRGNFAGAGRQAVDFLGDIVDAPLPGDWIPHVSGKGDYVSGSELVGADDSTPRWLRTAGDIGIGTLTDPLSFLSFGAAGAAKNAVKVGLPGVEALQHAIPTAKAMDPLSVIGRTADAALTKGAELADRSFQKPGITGPDAAPITQGYEGFKRGVRRTLGWQNITPEDQAVLDQARAAGSMSGKVSLEGTKDALAGLDASERTLLGDAFDSLDWGSLDPKAPGARPSAFTGMPLQQRVQILAQKYGKDPARLLPAAAKLEALAKNQWEEGLAQGAFKPVTGPNGQPMTGTPDYLQRQWTFPDKAIDLGEHGGVPGMASAIKGRELNTPEALADFIRTNPDVGYQRDVLPRMAKRAEQQGRLIEKARIGRAVEGPGATLQDDAGAVKANIEQIAASGDVDFADRLDAVYNGLPPRGPLMETIAKANRFFKPAAVYGVVLPRVGSIVRNQIGMLAQAATTPGAKVSDLKNSWNALAESFDDAWQSVTGSRVGKGGALTHDIATIEDAIKSAPNGDAVAQQLRASGRHDLADAVEQGVMDGFVSSEDVINKLAKGGNSKWTSLYDAPGVVFQGVEQRGRLGAFLEMRKRMPPTEAGKLTRDTFLDYNITSKENRTLRDIIPFAQFIAKSVPQQGKFLSRNPAAAIALNPLFNDPSGDQEPVYPWMQGKTRVNIGETDKGNPLYLTGLGLPVESLDAIPNLSANLRDASRDFAQGITATTQPLVKALTTYAMGGTDPYFGTPQGSYDKNPITGEHGPVGRAYNLAASTGLLQPIDTALQTIRKATDSSRSAGVRALDLLTGANVAEVDPNRAAQQVITQALESKPDVKQYRTFYGSEDPDMAALMQALSDAKKRAKQRREAAAQ